VTECAYNRGGVGGVETGDTLERAIRECFFEDVYLKLESKKELPVRTL